ncbi:MAG: hypothetical protein EP329_19455 [Deltaproteobacteria bacterium]|nr:MAG: hypothetical protein EP329_19455 [Deltaproteobacteria bacterium]
MGGTGLVPINFSVWGHFGVAERLELQVRGELPAGAELGLKWGVIGDQTASGLLLALSASIGGHFTLTQDMFSSDETTSEGPTSSRSYDRPRAWLVPVDATVQLGYRFGRDLVLYVAPRYSYRAHASADVERHGWGVTVGASAGPKTERLFVEFGLHQNPFPPHYARDFYEKWFTTLSVGMEWD